MHYALCTIMHYDALCTMKHYTLCTAHYAYIKVYKYAQENSKQLSRSRADASDDDDEDVGDEKDDDNGDVSVPKDARESTRLLSGPLQCTNTVLQFNCFAIDTRNMPQFCKKNFVCNRLCPLPLTMPGF